ncbi:hypothetical protein BD769DRAFT_1685139 [Suillus cothurnatus]|nr:hypothetical protein BD769DRAFT_1685139 [Suillus cothurnatus]
MSHMIPAGKYRIKNFLYKDWYVYMSEHGEVVSHDIQVDVKKEDEVEHLATLYDTTTKLYLTIGKLDDKVVADKNAQKLQWSSEDGVKFESVQSLVSAVQH